MTKRKITKNDRQIITEKTKDRATQIPYITPVVLLLWQIQRYTTINGHLNKIYTYYPIIRTYSRMNDGKTAYPTVNR